MIDVTCPKRVCLACEALWFAVEEVHMCICTVAGAALGVGAAAMIGHHIREFVPLSGHKLDCLYDDSTFPPGAQSLAFCSTTLLMNYCCPGIAVALCFVNGDCFVSTSHCLPSLNLPDSWLLSTEKTFRGKFMARFCLAILESGHMDSLHDDFFFIEATVTSSCTCPASMCFRCTAPNGWR